jgi:hypothetical protein
MASLEQLKNIPLIDLNTGKPTQYFLQYMLQLLNRTGGVEEGPLLPANNLGDLESISTARNNLGLGSIVTQDSNDVNLTGVINATTLKINTTTVTADANELNKLDGITASTTELNKLTGLTSSTAELNKLDGAPFDASFTIGTETANVINVAVQLKDAEAANIAAIKSLKFYLSDNSTGNNFIATAPSGTVGIGTNGALYDIGGNKKVFQVITNATGQFDINITETGVKTLYLVLILPMGGLKISSAITFA